MFVQTCDQDLKSAAKDIEADEPDTKLILKARPCDEDGESSGHDYANNPFTKILMNKLGPQFNPANLISKNKKMFHNLSMLDGLAICTDDENYERTYLDQIKIETNYQPDCFNKPIHIDKLFENED